MSYDIYCSFNQLYYYYILALDYWKHYNPSIYIIYTYEELVYYIHTPIRLLYNIYIYYNIHLCVGLRGRQPFLLHGPYFFIVIR